MQHEYDEEITAMPCLLLMKSDNRSTDVMHAYWRSIKAYLHLQQPLLYAYEPAFLYLSEFRPC
jgi:hypothetical protein